MAFEASVTSSPLEALSPQQTSQSDCNTNDLGVALMTCPDTGAAPSQSKKVVVRTEDRTTLEEIATAIIDLGKLLERRGRCNEAYVSYENGEKLGQNAQDPKSSRPNTIAESSQASDKVRLSSQARHHQQRDVVSIPNEPGRNNSLGLLQADSSTKETSEPTEDKCQQRIKKDTDKQEEILTISKGDEATDAKSVAEVAGRSVLSNNAFQDLLRELCLEIDHAGLLKVCHLERLVQLIQEAHPGYLDADDLAKILDLLSKRLRDTHQQSTHPWHQLALAVSHVLDAMVDTMIIYLGLSVKQEQEPDINSHLIWRSCVNDHFLLQYLEERVQQEPLFKEQLLAYVEHSKKEKKWCVAAANAMTILVRAGVQFNSADLQGIRIPGADLSYGVFDSANLQDADLRKVNFRGAWLRQSDLSRAQMAGVKFGELSFLTEDSEVRSCAYSPDGKSFADSLGSGNIQIYATSNWERTRTLKGHSDVVRCVVYSPKGDQIASASYDLTVRLWNAETGSLKATLVGHHHWVQGVAYSPQGNKVASASNDRTIRFWDVATGECRQMISCYNAAALCVAYSPKRPHIASGHTDSTVRIWSVGAGNCVLVLSGHTDTIWAVAYSPQGDQVASASEDTSVRLWDVETGACNYILAGHSDPVYSVIYSPSGDQIATGGVDQTVRIWDAETGLCRQSLNGHGNSVLYTVYSPKGDQLASASWDKTVRLWDVIPGSSSSVSCGHSSEVDSVKYSPRGDQFASGSLDNTIRLWDMEKGSCHHVLRGHTSTIFGLAYSAQGDQIASGSADSTVRLWDVEAGTCLHVLDGHSGSIQSIAYSPGGNRVASASDDMAVRLWDVVTGECIAALQGHSDAVMGIEYSPSGNQIASGSQDATVRIWNADTGAIYRILIGHTNWVRNVAYSPQGNELASAGYDKTIRLWDMETGESRLTLTGHSDRVKAIAYSKQGHVLASGSWDNTIRLWDVATGQCRAEIRNLPSVIHDIDWSTTSDANYLMAGIGDGSVLMWKVIEDEDAYRVRLHWSATSGILTVTEALTQGVRGLSSLNRQLLKQRGAIGEPEPLIRVVSELKQLSDGTALDSSASGLSVEQPVQQVEQAEDRQDTNVTN